MEKNTVFIVSSKKLQESVKANCPNAEVRRADIDLDAVDVSKIQLVVAGGIDFLSQMVVRLAARYLHESGSFKYVVPPRLCSRISDIKRVLHAAGLNGKCEIIVPLGGYMIAIARIANGSDLIYV